MNSSTWAAEICYTDVLERGRGSYSSVEEGVTINRPIAITIKLTLKILVDAKHTRFVVFNKWMKLPMNIFSPLRVRLVDIKII